MIRKDVVVAILITFCLTAALFLAKPTASQTTGQYDPNLHINHNGKMARARPTENVNVINWPTGLTSGNVNVTNWPSQLLSNYVFDSGFFTLGPYGNNSETYYTLSIAGYRQVSVYVGFDTNLNVSMEIRVGMGNFNTGIAGYMWATYYNISRVTGQFVSPFTQTINVQGPQLRIEVYNDENYAIDFMHVVAYVTC